MGANLRLEEGPEGFAVEQRGPRQHWSAETAKGCEEDLLAEVHSDCVRRTIT